MLPKLPLFNVDKNEFPVFIRLINALAETLSLFFFRKVEEKLDATRCVTVKMVSLRAPMRFSFGQRLEAGDDVEQFLVDAALAQTVECPR